MPRLYVEIVLLCKIFEKRWPLFFKITKPRLFMCEFFYLRISTRLTQRACLVQDSPA
jgi:hypothetical protein